METELKGMLIQYRRLISDLGKTDVSTVSLRHDRTNYSGCSETSRTVRNDLLGGIL